MLGDTLMESLYKDALCDHSLMPTFILVDVSWITKYNLACINFLSLTPKILLEKIVTAPLGEEYTQGLLESLTMTEEYSDMYVSGITTPIITEVELFEGIELIIDCITTEYYNRLTALLSNLNVADQFAYCFHEWVAEHAMVIKLDTQLTYNKKLHLEYTHV